MSADSNKKSIRLHLLSKFVPISLVSIALVLPMGCQTVPPTDDNQSAVIKDGPPDVELDPSTLVAAVPKYEPRARYGNHSPYTVFGKRYEVIENSQDLVQEGIASWYGTKFHGKRTSSWEPYDMFAMTAAHRSLPLPTYVKVTNLKNKRSTIVKVNDRGPFHSDRVIDLSYAAAVKLGFAKQGTAPVRIEAIPMSSLRDEAMKNSGAQLAHPTTDDATAIKAAIDSGKKSHDTRSQQYLQATKDRLFIQVGAFADRERAQQVQASLEEWINFQVTIKQSPDKDLFRVQIGPINNSVQAKAINQLLAKEFNIVDPMLVWN